MYRNEIILINFLFKNKFRLKFYHNLIEKNIDEKSILKILNKVKFLILYVY